MPNWCMNTLLVKGNTSSDVAAFVQPIIDNKITEEGRDELYHSMLETHVPLPNNKWDYDKAVATWGVKWPDRESSDRIHGNGDSADWSYRFDSPWAPPTNGIILISEQFPDLMFGLSFFEPGMGFAGGIVIKDTKILDEFEEDIPDFWGMFLHPDGEPDDDKATDAEMSYYDSLDDRVAVLMAKGK